MTKNVNHDAKKEIDLNKEAAKILWQKTPVEDAVKFLRDNQKDIQSFVLVVVKGDIHESYSLKTVASPDVNGPLALFIWEMAKHDMMHSYDKEE